MSQLPKWTAVGGILVLLGMAGGLAIKEMQKAPQAIQGRTAPAPDSIPTEVSVGSVDEAIASLREASSAFKGVETDGNFIVLEALRDRDGDGNQVLWHVDERGAAQVIRTFPRYEHLDVELKADGDDVEGFIRYRDAPTSTDLVAYERYDGRSGSVETIYENPLKPYAPIRVTGRAGSFDVFPVFQEQCDDVYDADMGGLISQSIKMVGLEIDGKRFPIAPSDVQCVAANEGYDERRSVEPEVSFLDFDDAYRVLRLRLPDGRKALINIDTKKVVAKKERYEVRKTGDAWSVFYMTPEQELGQPILEDIFQDPLLGKVKDSAPVLEFAQMDIDSNGNPTFNVSENFGEGIRQFGDYVLDLKTRRFRKL